METVRLLVGAKAFQVAAGGLLALALGAALGVGLGSDHPAAANVETITSTGISTLAAPPASTVHSTITTTRRGHTVLVPVSSVLPGATRTVSTPPHTVTHTATATVTQTSTVTQTGPTTTVTVTVTT